jgi:hypothetical protein
MAWGSLTLLVHPKRLKRFTLRLSLAKPQGNRVNGSRGNEAYEELIVPGRDLTL